MKKILITILAVFLVFLAAFFFVPSIGKKILRVQTSPMVLKEMRVEFSKLDNTFPRLEANERRRFEILSFMYQRGIRLDDGLREESIEHNISVKNILIMQWWRWEELLGRPLSQNTTN